MLNPIHQDPSKPAETPDTTDCGVGDPAPSLAAIRAELQTLPANKMLAAMGLNVISTLEQSSIDTLLDVRNSCLQCRQHTTCVAKTRQHRPSEALIDACPLWESRVFTA